mgnify:CR=1 FL=1|tara:strand:- start:16 stop:204 length:189 start_codon:yes stop_codon:yes gene_type:complete
MKKKVVYVVPRQEDVNLYNFAANRFLFKTFKSCGCDGYFSMNVTDIPKFDNDVDCSPISLGG